MADPPTSFLDLPPELRNYIYDLTFETTVIQVCVPKSYGNDKQTDLRPHLSLKQSSRPNILSVSAEMLREAGPVYWSRAVVILPLDLAIRQRDTTHGVTFHRSPTDKAWQSIAPVAQKSIQYLEFTDDTKKKYTPTIAGIAKLVWLMAYKPGWDHITLPRGDLSVKDRFFVNRSGLEDGEFDAVCYYAQRLAMQLREDGGIFFGINPVFALKAGMYSVYAWLSTRPTDLHEEHVKTACKKVLCMTDDALTSDDMWFGHLADYWW
ncbi:Putative 2EXR domain-containing protein [Septoria linicola]|uniref:2EXR domain-containing protein n=1 Tax=Septoria linicola TaxID=215465 RepID=A0A9Q9B5Z3_9PEZI|nr:putative 2EXR domain-containing protein [Septoria linicola]USW56951.1 Putative 2EXR domain-containing protein [Septoria linicola]